MAKRSVELIEHLIEKVALSGTFGINGNDCENLVREYYNEYNQSAEDDPQTSRGELFSEQPPRKRITISEHLLHDTFDSLCGQDDIKIRDVAPTFEDDRMVSSIKQLHGKRLFTTKDRMWQAITGHGVDTARIPESEFDCLSVISAHGSAGIIQPTVTKLTGQDKRSVPKRTDRLRDKGYIVKIAIVGGGSSTSLLKLKRFVNDVEDDASLPVGLGNGPPGSTFLDYDAWFRQLIQVLEDNNRIVSGADLRLGLNILPNSWEGRVFKRCMTRLIDVGCVRRINAQMHDRQGNLMKNTDGSNKMAPSVQLLRNPTDLDRTAWLKSVTMPQVTDQAAIQNEGSRDKQSKDNMDAVESETAGDSLIAEYSDDDLLGAGPTEQQMSATDASENSISWLPHLAFSNLMYHVVHDAGVRGLNARDIAGQTMGPFWRKNLDDYMFRLVEARYTQEQAHLPHRSLVKDTIIDGKAVVFQFRTLPNHQDALDIGVALPADETLDPELLRSHHPEVDAWGFPIPKPVDFVNGGGNATLTECKAEHERTGAIMDGDQHDVKDAKRPKQHSSTQPKPGKRTGRPIGSTKEDKHSRQLKHDERERRFGERDAEDFDVWATTTAKRLAERDSDLANTAGGSVNLIDLASSIKTEIMSRSRSGVYINPPGARFSKFESTIVKGRPRNAIIAVFKLTSLYDLEWFTRAGEHSRASVPLSLQKVSRTEEISAGLVSVCPSTSRHTQILGSADDNRFQETDITAVILPEAIRDSVQGDLHVTNLTPSNLLKRRLSDASPHQGEAAKRLRLAGAGDRTQNVADGIQISSSAAQTQSSLPQSVIEHAQIREDLRPRLKRYNELMSKKGRKSKSDRGERDRIEAELISATSNDDTGTKSLAANSLDDELEGGAPTLRSRQSELDDEDRRLVGAVPADGRLNQGVAVVPAPTTQLFETLERLEGLRQRRGRKPKRILDEIEKLEDVLANADVHVLLRSTATPSATIALAHHTLQQPVNREYVENHPEETFHHRGGGHWYPGMPPQGSPLSVMNSIIGPGALLRRIQRQLDFREERSSSATAKLDDHKEASTPDQLHSELPVTTSSAGNAYDCTSNQVAVDDPADSSIMSGNGTASVTDQDQPLQPGTDKPAEKETPSIHGNGEVIGLPVSNALETATISNGHFRTANTLPAEKALSSVRPNDGAILMQENPNDALPRQMSKLQPLPLPSAFEIASRMTMKRKTGGSLHLQRQQIILDALSQCHGVFPGNNELWYVYASASVATNVQPPDRQTVTRVIDSLVLEGKILRYTFRFLTKKGITHSRTIIATPEMTSDSPMLIALQEAMVDAWPDQHLPQEVNILPELRQQAMSNVKGQRRPIEIGYTEPVSDSENHTKETQSMRVLPVQQTAQRIWFLEDEARRLGFKDVAERRRHLADIRARNARAAWKRASRLRMLSELDFPSEDDKSNSDEESDYEWQVSPAQAAMQTKLQLENYTFEPDKAAPRRAPGTRKRFAETFFFEDDAERFPWSAMPNGRILSPRKKRRYYGGRSAAGGARLDSLSRHALQARPLYAQSFSRDAGISSLHHGGISQPGNRLTVMSGTDKPMSEVASRYASFQADIRNRAAKEHDAEMKDMLYYRHSAHRARHGELRPGGEFESDVDLEDIEENAGTSISLARPPGTRIYRGRDRQAHTQFRDTHRLVLAVALVTVLCPDVDLEHMNWIVTAKALRDEYEGEFLRRRWISLRVRNARHVEKWHTAIEEQFDHAYKSGHIAKAVFDRENIEAADWPELLRWVEANVSILPVKHAMRSIDPVHTLVELREKYTMEEDDAHHNTSADYFAATTDAPRREVMVDMYCGTTLDHKEPDFDLVTLIMSWCRAVAATQQSQYDPTEALARFKNIPLPTIDAAVDAMKSSQYLVQEKKGRQLPGRNFLIHPDVFAQFVRWPGRGDEHMYLPSLAKSRSKICDQFRQNEAFELPHLVNGSDYAVLINMVSQGLIVPCADLPAIKPDYDDPEPRLSPWGSMNGSYESKKEITSLPELHVRYIKTAQWTSEHSLKLHVPIPSRPALRLDPYGSPTPLWIDIHGNLLIDIWEMVLRSLLYMLVFRPGITIAEIVEAHSKRLWWWEVNLVLEWMRESCLATSEIVQPISRECVNPMNTQGWTASEWWYCIMLPEMTTWNLEREA